MPRHSLPRTQLNRLAQNHRHAGAAPGNVDLDRRCGNPEPRPEERGAPRPGGACRYVAVHAPPGSRSRSRASSPIGVEALQRAAEEELVVLVDLEVRAAAEADGVGGDVGDLGGMAVDAAAAKGEGRGGGGGDWGSVHDERDGGVAAREAEREVVRERVDEAGGDSDIEETNLEAGGVC